MSSKVGLVEQSFQGYVNMVYHGGVQAMRPNQLSQLRQAFYAGMTIYQGHVFGMLGMGDDVSMEEQDRVEALVNQIMSELEGFAESTVSGMAPAQGGVQ